MRRYNNKMGTIYASRMQIGFLLIINGVEISSRMLKPGHMKFSDFVPVYNGLFVSGVQHFFTNAEKTGL